MANDVKQSSPSEGGVHNHFEVDRIADGRVDVPLRVRSEDLLRGGKELEIEHAGALYRLRLTAMGRLILTK